MTRIASDEAGWLSPAQVAARFGVSVDTVRKWGQSGRLREYRTPAGHRRFRAQDVEALAEGRSPARPNHQPRRRAPAINPPEPDENEGANSSTTQGPPLPPPWERRALEARADVEVLRAHQALEEFDEATQRKRERAEREAAATAASAEESRRLAALKDHGRRHASWSSIPTVLQAKVGQVLERYVTSDRFPSGLSVVEAKTLIEEKVQDVIRPYKEAQEDDRLLRRLTDHGDSLASIRTLSWDSTTREEAREAVTEALEEELEPDWTEADVEDLVDEVLDEWDSEEDD